MSHAKHLLHQRLGAVIVASCLVVAAATATASARTASSASVSDAGQAHRAGTRAPATVMSTKDARGDVRVASGEGPTTALRRSIDVRKLTITDLGDRIRFSVKIARVLPLDEDFDQMVLMTIAAAPGTEETWRGDVGFAVQQPRAAFAYAQQDGTGTDYESCDPLVSTSQARTDVMRLDVPARCVPSGQAKVRLRAVAGYFRSDAGLFSSDTVKVSGVELP